MKGKVVNTILLLVVAAIWGYIGFSIYRAFGDEDETLYSPIAFQESLADSSQQIFSINPQYKDPFLKGISSQRISKRPEEAPIQKKTPIINHDMPSFDLERIQFTGVVSGIDKRMKAIVSLDEKNYLVGVGQPLSDIEIIQITSDSIKVRWKNHEFWKQKERTSLSF